MRQAGPGGECYIGNQMQSIKLPSKRNTKQSKHQRRRDTLLRDAHRRIGVSGVSAVFSLETPLTPPPLLGSTWKPAKLLALAPAATGGGCGRRSRLEQLEVALPCSFHRKDSCPGCSLFALSSPHIRISSPSQQPASAIPPLSTTLSIPTITRLRLDLSSNPISL